LTISIPNSKKRFSVDKLLLRHTLATDEQRSQDQDVYTETRENKLFPVEAIKITDWICFVRLEKIYF